MMMNSNILLIGSLNMDFTTYVGRIPDAGETIAGKSFLMSPGGKGLNQAIALSRAGSNVYMLGTVGNDSLGNELIDLVKKEKIHSLIKTSNNPTGTAFIFVEESGQNRITIIHGANYDLTFDDIKNAIDEVECQYVCFQLENNIEVIEKGIKYAKNKGKIVVLNPAPAQKLKDDVFQYIDYFTPNEKELNFYIDENKDLLKSCTLMLKKGVKNLIVTLGEKGAFFINNNEQEIIPSFKVKAIDTVAAGDCFNGYFVSSINKGIKPIEAIKIANKASSIAVTRMGASKSIPYINEIKM